MLAYNLHRHIHFNQEVDPTRTKTLRDRFAVEMRRRFNIITSLIRHAIVDKDVFGLSPVTLITKRQAMEEYKQGSLLLLRPHRKWMLLWSGLRA